MRPIRLALALAAAVLLPALAPPARPAGAEQACFAETGQCVSEPFLSYWRDHGGLAINGYPISTASPERLEDGKTYTVQYFERARFEYHPEDPPPYDVLLGQFGRLLYLADAANPQATAVPPRPGATYFNATGHNLSGDFLAYWQANGGLAQFGYPLSEEFTETLEDGKAYAVQYFERARFERHPENAPPYDVELGQFGRRILDARGPLAALPFLVSGRIGAAYTTNFGLRVRLGPPTAAATRAPGAFQAFEHGLMVWRGDTRTIYVLALQPSASFLGNWTSYPDTWDASQPVGGGPTGQPTYTCGQLYAPAHGFGKVWREHPEVQQLLGYAFGPGENGQTFTIQPFLGGLVLDAPGLSPANPRIPPPGGAVFVLYDMGRFELPSNYSIACQ